MLVDDEEIKKLIKIKLKEELRSNNQPQGNKRKMEQNNKPR